jgi:hypothetical protein
MAEPKGTLSLPRKNNPFLTSTLERKSSRVSMQNWPIAATAVPQSAYGKAVEPRTQRTGLGFGMRLQCFLAAQVICQSEH